MSDGANYMAGYESAYGMAGSGDEGLSSATTGGGGMSSGWGIGISSVGSLMSIYTSITGAKAQAKVAGANARLAQAQGRYSASVQDYNKAVAEASMLAIRTTADFEIERQKVAEERFGSKQRAGYAKAGVKTSGGSPMMVMIDSAKNFKIDQAITDYNAKIGIGQSSSKAEQYGQLSSLEKSNAQFRSSNIMTASKYRTGQAWGSVAREGGSLLSTVGGLALGSLS